MANRENMEKWAAALESGEFTQGFGSLCSVRYGHRRYCCLGVACEIALRNGVGLIVSQSGTEITYNGASGLLPLAVSDWLGLDGTEDPSLTGMDGLLSVTATELNDGEAASFTEIAAMIRHTYLRNTEQEN